MDQRHLAAKAQNLTRTLYASLPWGYRVAHLLVRLAYSLTDTLGKVVYAEFIKAGVEGLPSADNFPFLSRHPERLPDSMGREFGKKAYAFVLSKVRNPEDTEDILGTFMVNVARKGLPIEPGSSLREAERYAFMAIRNAVRDYWRGVSGRPGRGEKPKLVDLDPDEHLQDPNVFRQLDDLLSQTDFKRLLREIARVHPKAKDWLEAQLYGMSDRELAEQWGVSPPRVNQLKAVFVPEVKKIVMEYLEAA